MVCAVCDSEHIEFLFEKNGYRLGKCMTCSLVQLMSMPTVHKLEDCYDKDFFDKYYEDLASNGRKQRYVYNNFNNKLKQIEKKLGRKGKILDVGCSFGFFLNVARQRGWDVAGIELSKYAADYAKERLGLLVLNKSIIDAELNKKSYDVITMWYVIEHLPNPMQILRHLTGLMKDDGMLVISTSNVDGYIAKIRGHNWRIWILPEHVLYFSPQSIRNLYAQSDLKIVAQESALPYEKYFRKVRLYSLINALKLSDNLVYYAKKLN